jgi:hypothetical protein
MKDKKTKYNQAHTDNTKYGMGDYYGTGIRAKVGRLRDDSVGASNLSKKQLKTPPKSLA